MASAAERLAIINESDARCACGADPKADPEAHKVESGWIMEVAPALYSETEEDSYEAVVICPACSTDDTEAHEARDMRGLHNTDPVTVDEAEAISETNPTKGPVLFIALCGARFNGLQKRQGKEPLVIFTDPITKSTCALPLSEVTIGNVWRKLAEKRAAYRSAMGEA